MSNELATVPLDQVERMAMAIAKSGLFGIKTPDQALALMLIAQAEGRHPATAASEYHIISGKPSLRADAMLARFQGAGGSVEWTAHSDIKVAAKFSHPQGGTVEIDWDMARAKQAGLISGANSGTWSKYPRQMLRARVISEGVRSCFPGATGGLYTEEEVMQFDSPRSAPAKHMGDAEVVPQEIAPPPEPPFELMEQANEAAQRGMSAYAAFWQATGAENRKLIGASRHADFKMMAAEVRE